jgi:hypothetical protein
MRDSEDSVAYAARVDDRTALKEEVREVMGGEGWSALGWSFLASGGMTVSIDNNRP